MSERGPAFVVAACISRDEKVLLAQRNQPNNPLAHLKWELPGGKVKLVESPHQALVREIKEELGTDVKLVRLLPHVQSNIYHTTAGVVHSIVVAFHCLLPSGAPEPRPSEPAVLQVRWVKKEDLSQFSLLPGTKQFIDCLERLDSASYGAANIFVRLERANSAGQQTDFWEFRIMFDLWSQMNLLERHGNVFTRSTHYRLRTNIPQDEVLPYVAARVKKLLSRGYRVRVSDDPRIMVGMRN